MAYALALAAVAPFCGYLQDLIGRRNITLLGGLVLCVGIIVMGTARHFRDGLIGMGLSGAGAAVVSKPVNDAIKANFSTG